MTESRDFANISRAALHGESHDVKGIEPFPCRRPHSICFLTDEVSRSDLPPAVGACTVFAPAGMVEPLRAAGYTVIEAASPKFELARAWAALSGTDSPPDIHPTAIVGAGVSLGANVGIGPYSVLDGDIRVGDNCRIGARCSLSNSVTLGTGVRLRNGNVLGEDAFTFGFRPPGEAGDGHPRNVRFPSTGGIRVGDFVEIGNNCVISRGVFDDTRIADHVRINDLVHIGNTVEIDTGALIMAQTDISARVQIGADCWVGQSAAVRQGVRIGEGAQVGMGAVVVSDVSAGMLAMGVPARHTGKRQGF